MDRAGADALDFARDAARAAGVGGDVILFASGSLPVFAAGDGAVVKLYPAPYEAECERERAALEACTGRLPVETPRPRHVDRRDGCTALVMTRVRGRPLSEVWPRATPAERVAVAEQVGRLLRALHEV